MRKINLIGQKFGRLIVISDTGKRKSREVVWACRCECGKLTEVVTSSLCRGLTKSCGCLWRERIKESNTIHGDDRRKPGGVMRLYKIWDSMKQRCLNPKCRAYKRYGGRGIRVCPEWQNSYLAFKAWALANGYQDDLTIDRFDSDGNYCPENCRWIPKSENSRNGAFKRWGNLKLAVD